MDPQQVQALLQQLDQMLTSAGGALTSTNADAFNEMVRQFNLNYTNAVAGQYGYNTGVGQPGPAYAPTLSAQTAAGYVGYVPGYSGVGADQTLAAQGQVANEAAQQANLTGAYTAPGTNQYTPGTFVELDPNSPQAQQSGQQLAYVLPTGQIQRLTLQDAQAMGYKGNAVPINYQTFMSLAQGPPQGYTTQTAQSQQQYFNENQAAQQAALQQAGVTGMYTSPATIQAPGYAIDGSSYFTQSPATQQAYLARYGNPQAAQAAWVQDTNAAVTQAYQSQGKPLPGGPGTPQETMQAEQQFFNQANQLGTEYGQYYSPLAPGQTGQAGVNMPRPGQITEQGREFNVNTASDLAKLASSLTGPADYFKYLQALNGGRDILQNLYTGGGQTAGGAVGSTGGAQSLDNILAQFGLNSSQLTGGMLPQGAYGQAGGVQGQAAPGQSGNWSNNPTQWTPMEPTWGPNGPGGITPPSAYAGGQVGGTPSGLTKQGAPSTAPATAPSTGTRMNAGGGGGAPTPTIASNYQLPPPNQIQPTAYYNLSPSGQQFIQGAYAAAGYNPQDINWFVSQETPATSSSTPGAVSGGGTAGSSTRFANPAGQSLFA